MKRRKEFHHYAYLFGLALMGACLPLSKYLVSASVLFLALNWLAEGNLGFKLRQVYRRKSILAILSILILYLAGMLYTECIQEGFKRILSFLPVIALILILGTIRPMDRKELRFLLIVFSAAVTVSSLFSMGHFYGWFNKPAIQDIREISSFVPHLYLSLMVNMAVIILLYLVFYDYFATSFQEKGLFTIMLVWLVYFVFFLKSFLGITIFIIVFPVFLIGLMQRLRAPNMRIAVLSGLILLLISLILLIAYSFSRFYAVDESEHCNLESHTANGNLYTHQESSRQIENGHFVWLYYCEEELRKEWNTVSRYSFDGQDQKGQDLRFTLIRYLTSKGLRKDSAGLHQLTSEDIALVENGYPNYIFRNKYGIYQRIYQIIWELDMYIKTGEVHSHSVTQRIVFQKHALKLIRKSWLTGVGTGDIKASMIRQNQLDNTRIQQEWEGKPHNQYLNFAATFGLPGFCWIVAAFLLAIRLEKKGKVLLMNFFMLIYGISMLSMDTMDSHVGISFLAFFYALLLFSPETQYEEP